MTTKTDNGSLGRGTHASTHPGAAAAAAALGVPGEPARWNALGRFAEDAGAPGSHVTAWEWL